MSLFVRHQVHLLTGKGGVGKSTVVAALAVAAAERGHRPLVVELGHRATMESMFDVPIGYDPVDVGHGVCALNMELEPALHDYVAEQVKSRMASRIVRLPVLRRFFHAAPAVAEIATLRRLSALSEEEHEGTKRWHPILVDLDATGHARMFLALPKVLGVLGDKPPLKWVLERVTALLEDEARTRLHFVTLPSELPAQETRELYAQLVEDKPVALGSLVINRMPSMPLGPEDESAMQKLALVMPVEVAMARRATRVAQRARQTAEQIKAELPMPSCELPEHADADSVDALRDLGARLWEVS